MTVSYTYAPITRPCESCTKGHQRAVAWLCPVDDCGKQVGTIWACENCGREDKEPSGYRHRTRP